MSEAIVKDILVHDKKCTGCVRHNSEVMLSYRKKDDSEFPEIHDLFLNKEQAERLFHTLKSVIARNASQTPF